MRRTPPAVLAVAAALLLSATLISASLMSSTPAMSAEPYTGRPFDDLAIDDSKFDETREGENPMMSIRAADDSQAMVAGKLAARYYEQGGKDIDEPRSLLTAGSAPSAANDGRRPSRPGLVPIQGWKLAAEQGVSPAG